MPTPSLSPLMPALVTVQETAAALRLSRATVFRMLASGELPSIKIGASRRIRTADLAALIERGA